MLTMSDETVAKIILMHGILKGVVSTHVIA